MKKVLILSLLLLPPHVGNTATKSTKSELFCLNGKQVRVHHPEGVRVDWAKGVDVYQGKCDAQAVWYEPAVKRHETELLIQRKVRNHEIKD